MIGAADVPVRKLRRSSNQLVRCNGGLHFHAIMLVPPVSRLRENVSEHVRRHADMYTGSGRLMSGVDVRPVRNNHARAVDYILKSVASRRSNYDDAVLVLPRSASELA